MVINAGNTNDQKNSYIQNCEEKYPTNEKNSLNR